MCGHIRSLCGHIRSKRRPMIQTPARAPTSNAQSQVPRPVLKMFVRLNDLKSIRRRKGRDDDVLESRPPFQTQRACSIEPRVRQNPGVGSTECPTSSANRKAVLSIVCPGRNRVAVRRKDGRRSISRPKVAAPAARDRQPWAGSRKALGLQSIDRFLTSCPGSGMRKWTLPSGGQSDNLFENRSRRSGRSL